MKPLARFSQLALAALAIVIMVGTFFGRKIEKSFPEFIPFIPPGATVVLIALYFLGRSALNRGNPAELDTLAAKIPPLFRRFDIAIALMAAAAGAIICEGHIQMPIERIHFFKYSFLALILFFATYSPRLIVRLETALAVGSLIGLGEEFLQRLVPGRVFDWRDIGMNCMAVVVGSLLAPAMLSILQKAHSGR